MRRNTDIEIPQVRIRIHILCEAYARAETPKRKSEILNDIELQVFHAADLLAWDMVEATDEQVRPEDAPRTEVSARNGGGHAGSVAA